MNTITMQRDHIGRFATKPFLIRALIWVLKAPFRVVHFLAVILYNTLAVVLPARRTAYKLIVGLVVLLSFVMNAYLARQLYVVNCSVGGHFMTQEKCDELYTAKFDSQELARLEFISSNEDLFNQ